VYTRTCTGLIVGFALVTGAAARAQEATAVRANGDVPVVDGRLDEPAWHAAPPVRDLVQRNPDEGAAPSESTSVRFVYTDHDLYVAIRAYDSDPDRIVGRLTRRDGFAAADGLTLYLDSYNDQRTAYEFTFNPSGARRDVFIYDDGGGRDDSWDPVYDWSTAVDSLGWTLELRVPFSQLRFPAKDSLAFGIRVRRSINRRNEEANWPFVPRDQAGEVSRYGSLVGLNAVPSPRRVEFLPYTAGSASFQPSDPANPFLATGRRSAVRGGADFKVGITSGVTADLTVNPDFGQVEADASVVNLSEFESFFPEKRPFFVEGTNLFQFGMAPTEGGEFGFMRGGEEGLVYTRRVGRSPHVDPELEDGYAEDVGQSTILGAGKLSGRLGGGWSLGLLQAVTAKEFAATVDGAGVAARTPVEPLTSHSVARLERVLNRGRTAHGVTGTAVVRRLDESAFAGLHARAFTGGADMSARLGGDRYQLDLALMGSRVEGTSEAILGTQENSARYFQRPDNDHTTLDSTRTSLHGFGGYAQIRKVVGFATWRFLFATRSPGFETNDLGYLRQADQHTQRAEVELRWLTPGRVFRQFEMSLDERSEFTYGWERTRTSIESRVSGTFLNYWNVSVNAERRFASTDVRLLRGGPAADVPGAWDLRLSVRSDRRRSMSLDATASRTTEDVGGAEQWRLNGGVRYRPGALSLSANIRGSWGVSDRQYVTQTTVVDSTYYVVGRVNRRELALTLRAELALTPRLSFEFYAEPFASAARYETLRLAADLRAREYADRFDVLSGDRMTRPRGETDVRVDVDRDGVDDFSFEEPDFSVLSLRTNAVLRWEFLPGSTLFLVWQQSRRDRLSDGNIWVPSALDDAIRAEGSHVFAVKISYWLGL
jgi:hypothetical protein